METTIRFFLLHNDLGNLDIYCIKNSGRFSSSFIAFLHFFILLTNRVSKYRDSPHEALLLSVCDTIKLVAKLIFS